MKIMIKMQWLKRYLIGWVFSKKITINISKMKLKIKKNTVRNVHNLLLEPVFNIAFSQNKLKKYKKIMIRMKNSKEF